MKQYKESAKGWYALAGDGNIVIATSKSLDFEFEVLEWKNAGDVFVGKVKRNNGGF